MSYILTEYLRDLFLPTPFPSSKWPTITNENIYRFPNQCANSSIHFSYCRQVLRETICLFTFFSFFKSQAAAVNNWVKWKISAIAGSMEQQELLLMLMNKHFCKYFTFLANQRNFVKVQARFWLTKTIVLEAGAQWTGSGRQS